MSQDRNDDARWISLVAGSYRPPGMTPARRAAFDEALENRLALRRRTRPWASLGAFGTAAAVVAAVLVVSSRDAGEPALEVATSLHRTPSIPSQDPRPQRTIETLLSLTTVEQADRDQSLPADYVEIEAIWLDA